jgi:hypothetical protein
MYSKQPKPKKQDAVAILLKASFSGRRRSAWRLIIPILVIAAILSLLAWWLLPASAPSQVLMAVQDAVALPDENVKLWARLESVKSADRGTNLSGCDIYFQAIPSSEVLGKASTRADGVACLDAHFPAAVVPVRITARYAGIKDRQRGAEAESRVFFWPADTSLLIVDVDHTLINESVESAWEISNLDLRAKEKAAESLQKVAQTQKAVYFSTGANRAYRYNKLRAWLGQGKITRRDVFPDGPLLAPVGDDPRFVEELAGSLKNRFLSKHLAITGDVESARVFLAAGFETIFLGPLEEPQGQMKILRGWSEIASQKLP